LATFSALQKIRRLTAKDAENNYIEYPLRGKKNYLKNRRAGA